MYVDGDLIPTVLGRYDTIDEAVSVIEPLIHIGYSIFIEQGVGKSRYVVVVYNPVEVI